VQDLKRFCYHFNRAININVSVAESERGLVTRTNGIMKSAYLDNSGLVVNIGPKVKDCDYTYSVLAASIMLITPCCP